MRSGGFLAKYRKGLLFALFLFYLYFRGIGDHGLLDPLEGVNASVGLDMVLAGRAFSPHLGEAACAGRALGSWQLSALALRLLGWQEGAARFWPALSGLLSAWAAAWAVRRGGLGKWLAAAVTASLTLAFAASQLASPHAPYACCTALALAAMLRAPRWRKGLAVALAVVAALVVYGPEGLILPWVALFLFAIATDRPEEAVRPYLPALGLSLAGAGAAALLLWVKNPLLLRFWLFETPHFLRPTGTLALGLVLGGSLPWTGFLIRAAWEAVAAKDPEGEGTPAENPELFMAVWALAFALGAFLTGDLLALAACAPALGALAGSALGRWLEAGELGKVREAVALNLAVLAPAVLIGVPLAGRAFPLLGGALLSLGPWGAFLLLFALASWHYARTRQAAKLARNLSAAALLCLMPLAGVFDLAAERGSIRDVGLALHRAIQRGDVTVQYGVNHPSLFFYTFNSYATVNAPLLPGVEKAALDETALHLIWEGRDRAFLLIPQDQQPRLPLPQDVYPVYQANGLLLLGNRYH